MIRLEPSISCPMLTLRLDSPTVSIIDGFSAIWVSASPTRSLYAAARFSVEPPCLSLYAHGSTTALHHFTCVLVALSTSFTRQCSQHAFFGHPQGSFATTPMLCHQPVFTVTAQTFLVPTPPFISHHHCHSVIRALHASNNTTATRYRTRDHHTYAHTLHHLMTTHHLHHHTAHTRTHPDVSHPPLQVLDVLLV